MANTLLTGGGGGGGSSGGGGGDAGTGSDGSGGIGGTWLLTLRKFAEAPVAFILGAILSIVFDGINAFVTQGVSILQLLLWGDYPLSTAGSWGIADLPLYVAVTLVDAVTSLGTGLEGALSAFFGVVASMVAGLGPLAPLAFAAVIGVTIIVAAYVIRFIWTLVVDALNPL